MAGTTSALLTLTGHDRPGVAASVLAHLAGLALEVSDVEQVQVHGRLLLCIEVAGPARLVEDLADSVLGDLGEGAGGLVASVTVLGGDRPARGGNRLEPPHHLVTVVAPQLGATALSGVCRHIADSGANIDRVVRLATYPVTAYELAVSGGDQGRLRRDLVAGAGALGVDVAVQRAGLHRRAKHLIVLDADSTLLQGEVIDLLAERAGCGAEVAAVTAAAMAGELDFAQALGRRLELLAGTEEGVLADLADDLVLTPGARTLVRTLKRLGYVTAVVSGGFVQVIEKVTASLGIDLVAANTLEVEGGRLTGRLVGPLVDRAGKAAALSRFAQAAGVPLAQTIAVGDGANDLDMLAAAGLGIAFNAKPVVRGAADASLSVPYLDAILYLLGISRHEVEAADEGTAAAGGVVAGVGGDVDGPLR